MAIGRSRILIVSLVLLGWAVAAAHAEDAAQPQSQPAPPGTRTLAETPFQLVLPREHLFGDWAGSRTWLEERGITPTLTFVGSQVLRSALERLLEPSFHFHMSFLLAELAAVSP